MSRRKRSDAGRGRGGRDERRKEVAAARTDEYENGGKAAKAIGLRV